MNARVRIADRRPKRIFRNLDDATADRLRPAVRSDDAMARDGAHVGLRRRSRFDHFDERRSAGSPRSTPPPAARRRPMTARAIGPMRASSLRAPLLKSCICRMMYSAGSPRCRPTPGGLGPTSDGTSRTHSAPDRHDLRRGRCSSGKPVRRIGVARDGRGVVSFVLPGTRTVPVIGAASGCTGSGMLKAHAGKPFGTVRGACAGAGVCAAAFAAQNAAREIVSKVRIGVEMGPRMNAVSAAARGE